MRVPAAQQSTRHHPGCTRFSGFRQRSRTSLAAPATYAETGAAGILCASTRLFSFARIHPTVTVSAREGRRPPSGARNLTLGICLQRASPPEAEVGNPASGLRSNKVLGLHPRRSVRTSRARAPDGAPLPGQGLVRMSWLVGRVLFAVPPRDDTVGDHPSRGAVADTLERPTRELGRTTLERSLSGLAPGGVCPATTVTRRAGGLLHHRFTLASAPRGDGGLFSVALIPRVAPGGRYPPPRPVEPGPSSASLLVAVARPAHPHGKDRASRRRRYTGHRSPYDWLWMPTGPPTHAIPLPVGQCIGVPARVSPGGR